MNDPKPILFFDGECNLCNSSVDFLIRFNKGHHFYIASLQGKTAPQYLSPEQIEKKGSLVLWTPGGVLQRSEAVFKVISLSKSPLRVLLIFSILPRFFLDWIYNVIAQNRYRLFGKKSTCRLPTPQERAYFLD